MLLTFIKTIKHIQVYENSRNRADKLEPNLVQMRVPVLKRYLQVQGISVANKQRDELLDLCGKAHELAIDIIDEQVDQKDISAKLVTYEGTIPDPYSLHSDWTTVFSLLSNYTRATCTHI